MRPMSGYPNCGVGRRRGGDHADLRRCRLGARERGAVVVAEGRIRDPAASRCPTRRRTPTPSSVEVTVPTKYPIAFVSVKPMTGWTITTEKTTLPKPVKTDDGSVTEAVSKITWTATAGGLEPGQFDLFTVSAGPLPTKPSKLEFKAVQTYSDGTIVRWIEPTVKGTPEPEHPAPTLTLTKAASEHGH